MLKRNLLILFSVVFILLISTCKKEQTAEKEENENINNCTVTLIDGKVSLVDESNNFISDISLGDDLNENQIVKTDEGSSLELQIGDGSVIRIKENSIVKIIKLFKDHEAESTTLNLNVGKILAKPKKLTEGSDFEIETDSVAAGVRGTEFTVYVPKGESTRIAVNEGTVYVKKKIDNETKEALEKIDNIDKNIALDIDKKINEEIILTKDEKIEVNHEEFKKVNEEISKEIAIIAENLENNKNSNEKISEISKEVESKTLGMIEKKSNEVLKKEIVTDKEWKESFNKEEFKELKSEPTINKKEKEEKEDKKIEQKNETEDKKEEAKTETEEIKKEAIVIEKTGNLGINLSEKSSAITQGDKYFYISSDIDKKIYCIDPESNKIVWTFSNSNISKIQSPAVSINGSNLILATYNNIFVINNQGKSILTQNITNGTSYWASPVIIGKNIYIPTSRNIYIYNGSTIEQISENELPTAGSQTYIGGDNTSLFIVESLDKNIKAFNLNNKKVDWASNKIQNIVFTPPIKVKNYLIVGDSKNILYRFDLSSSGEKNDSLNIPAGVISNIVSNGSNIYFVAQDGWFYNVNIDSFQQAKKIIKVDVNPSQDKYLTKKILKSDSIYYGTDSGKLFIYDLKTGEAKLYEIEENKDNNPIIGTPVKINDALFLVDNKSNVYKRFKTLK